MINKFIIDENLDRLDLGDYDYTVVETDDSGDYIKAIFPELSFERIFKLILQNKIFYRGVQDIGPNLITMSLRDRFDGLYASYYMKVERSKNLGVDISFATKRVDHYDEDGNYLPCLSFEMQKNYVELNRVD
jgi:hypothetical protein